MTKRLLIRVWERITRLCQAYYSPSHPLSIPTTKSTRLPLAFVLSLIFTIVGSAAFGQGTCSETLTASGQDDDPTEVVFTSFPCTAGGTITAMDLTTNNTSSFCLSWYEYTIEVVHGGGTETLSGQCNVTNMDLATFNQATIDVSTISSIKVTSGNSDTYSDPVTVDATVNITYTPAACPGPSSLTTSNITTTSADIDWAAGGSETLWDIEWGTGGFTPGTGSTVSGVGSKPYSLTGLTPNTAYDYYVRADCGTETSVWVGPYQFYTAAMPLTLPYANDFEASLGDFMNDGANSDDWMLNATYYSSGSGSIHNAYSGGANNILLLPNPIDLVTYPNASLTFDHIAKTEGGYDYALVEYSSDGGSTWQSIPATNYLGSSLDYSTEEAFHEDSYSDWGTTASTPANTWWKTESFSLAGLSGGSIHVRFRLTADGSVQRDGWYIDNLSVTNPSCSQPTTLGVTKVTASSADLFWTTGGASDWNVEYGSAGFTPGTGAMLNATNDTISITGLSDTTDYDFFVRDSCGVGSVSSWAGPYSFTTLCTAIAAPWSEDFENGGSIPSCWSQGASNAKDWEFRNSGTGHIGNGGTMGGSTPSGGYFAWVDDSSPHVLGTTLESPLIDVSALTVPMIKFYRISDNEGDSNVDFRVEVWDGAAWNQVYFTNSNTLNGEWEEVSVSLHTLTITGDIQIRFIIDENNGTDFDDDVAIDDVSVVEAPSCIAPASLAASNVTASSVDLTWISGGASDWEVEYGAPGFTVGTGTRVAASSNNPYNLSGLSANTEYEVYVRDSCGTGDVSSWSSSIVFTTLCANQLAGTYTINSASPTAGTNFNSFSEVADQLNDCGVSGAVTFNIAAGTYTDSLHLMEITGASSTNTITFDGSDSTLVTLTFSSSNDMPTVFLEGADYVTLRNMTIENTSTSDGWGVMLQNMADNNTVEMCHIRMPVTSTTDIIGLIASSSLTGESAGDNANNLTVSNCLFTGGESGITLEGGTTSSTHNVGNTISNNVFRNQDDHGIDIDGQTGLTIVGNDIDNLINSGADAIYMIDVDDFNVSSNRVISPDYGIYINDGNDGHTPTDNSTVINNMVISTSDYGIYLNDFEYVEVYHNTVIGEPAMQINDQDNVVIIKNNIFYSTAGYAFVSSDALNATDVIDYNVYFTGAADAFSIGTPTYTDLAAWQSADPGLNSSSLEGDPGFLDPASDLHLIGTLANDVGDPSVGVTVDIDGETRSGTTPDIGADEYTPPSCSPSSGGTASNITSSSADLSWTPGDGTSFNIEYGAAGFVQGTGTPITGVSNPYTLSGLSPQTAYDFYVQDDCGGSTSPWVGPFSFTTPCVAVVAPWSEDFENGGSIPNCWSQGASNNKDWEFDNTPGSNHIGNNGTMGGNTSSGGYFAWLDDSSPHELGTTLESPMVDVSGLSVPALSFYYISHNEGNTNVDFSVEVWDGAAWNVVHASNSNSANGEWEEVIVDLSTLTITGDIQIRFIIDENNGTDFYDDVAIDDVSVIEMPSCTPPTGLGATNITATSTDLFWMTGGASDWTVEYGTAGFVQGSGTMVNASNDTLQITGLTATTAYEFYVRDSCGLGDVSTWAGPFSFLTGFNLPQPLTCTLGNPSMIFTEEFDDNSAGWTGAINGGNDTWEIPDGATSSNTGADNAHSGSNYMNFEASNTSVSSGAIVSPPIDLSQGQGDAELSFWMHAYGADMGTLTVSVSTSPSGPWTPEFTWSGQYQTSGSDPWVNVGVDLSSYVGQIIYLEFHQLDDGSTYTGDMSIDLVEVSTCLTCPPPSALGALNETVSSADVHWTTGGASDWNVEYGPAGFALGTGDTINATNDTVTLNGLSMGTDYEFYVRDSCGAGDVSPWVGPFSFTTLCGTFTAPYLETFTGTSTPNCWSQSAASGGPWEFTGTPDFGSTHAMPDHTNGVTNNYAWVDQSGTDAGVILEGPEVDVSGLTNPQLSYWVVSHNNSTSVSVYNILYAEAWDGTNWTAIDSVQGDFGLQWVEFTADLMPYIYNTNLVKVRFRQESGGDGNDYDNDMLLDDVGIVETPTCFVPTNLSSATTSNSSADISWTTGGASDWNIEYGPAGFSLGSGSTMSASTSTVSVTGLLPNIAYEYYVRDSCAVGDVSAWAGPQTFGAVVPCENFELYSTGLVDDQSVLINGWAGVGGDAEISTDYASSGSNSLKIHDSGSNASSDVLAEVGTYDSGAWRVAMDLYIPSGNGGYYNILHSYTGPSNVWAIEVTLDSNGTATVAEGTNGSGTIGTYNYTPGAWNTIEHIIDLDNDTAYIEVNGVATSVGWQFSLGSSNFGDQFNAVNFYSTAPTGQTPLIYFDDFCITPESTTGAGCIVSNIVNDSICTPGNTGFTATPGNYVALLNAANQVAMSDDTLAFFTSVDTTVTLYEVMPLGNSGHVGPMTSIAGSGFGNYTNGQYITVMDTIRIDSMTVRANGQVTAQVVISADDSGNSEIQRGEMFTTGSATGDYQVEVGIVLTPGVYFVNVDFISGSGQLFRATAGANYPYVLPGLMSIDSTNFSNQSRIYYTFDMVVSEMCIGTPVSVTSYIVGLSAGSDATIALCDDGSSVDLTSYLSSDASAGGTFSSATASAAISGNILDPSLLVAANYTVVYAVPSQGDCPADTALIDITVESCASCATLMPPALVGDTTCGPGAVTFSATTSATDVIWYNAASAVTGYGAGSVTANITTDTTVWAASVLSSGPRATVGPSVNTFSNAYPTGNFTNGQWITAHQTVRIDSATFAVDGALDFMVAIHDANRTDTLQTSKLISFSGADTAQKEVGIVLSPGTYFINTMTVSGSGVLFRPLTGASYPYGIDNLLTADSSDFGPSRYYYLYEMIVSGACISPIDSAMGIIETPAFAGGDSTGVVCVTNTGIDLSTYLTGADPGGAWIDDNATGALTGSLFDPSQVAGDASYTFTYAAASGPCVDSATVTILVEALPIAGTGGTDTVCTNNTAIDLTTYLGANFNAGGTWFDVDASGGLSGAMFDPSNTTAGQPYTFRYLVSTASCGSDSATVSIYVDQGPTAGPDAGDSLCDTDAPVDLSTYLSANANTGGMWTDMDGSGGLTGSMFDPSAVIAGQTYHFRYSVSSAACGGDSATVSIYVDQEPTAGPDAGDSLCDTDAPVDLSTYLSANANTGGMWADMDGSGGLTGSMFDPSAVTAGQTYHFRYSVSSAACGGDSATISIFVDSAPLAGTDAADTLCDTLVPVDLTNYLDANAIAGGTWFDVDASGGLSASLFDPGAVTANQSYSFQYVVSTPCGVDTAMVTIFVDDCHVSISEYTQGLINVFPNPTTSSFFVERPQGDNKITIEVYSTSGQLLMKEESQQVRTELDLSGFADGIYNVRILHGDGMEIHRITKQ